MAFERPRGTRDYLPEECEERLVVMERIREVFESYGYGEVVTPAFEHLELLTAKAGEDVVEQIYWFVDKAGRRLGLRFEVTTPIARVIAKLPPLPKPIRLYYIQPVWRYEEPQRGRLREFWHAGVELMGVPGAVGDAEVIAVMVNSIRGVGLQSFTVLVNDRRVVEGLLAWAGVRPEDMPRALRAIDKLERRGVNHVEEELSALCPESDRLKKVVEWVLSSDVSQLPLSELSESSRAGVSELELLLEELREGYGITGCVKPSLRTVRGLDYYTSLVYEVVTPLGGEVGSIAGGGRYDDLVKLVGGPPLPATGMAIGVERLMEALKSEDIRLGKGGRRGVYVIPLDSELRQEAIKVAEALRGRGLRVAVELMGRKLTAALEYADKQGYRHVIIVGHRELKEGYLTVRNLEEWQEERVPLESLVQALER